MVKDVHVYFRHFSSHLLYKRSCLLLTARHECEY